MNILATTCRWSVPIFLRAGDALTEGSDVVVSEIDGSRVARVLGTGDEARGRAVGHLREYFGNEGEFFTGSLFETFAQAESDPYKIGTGDLLALSMLSVAVTGEGAAYIMSDAFQAEATALLKKIPVDVSFEDEAAAVHLREEGESAGSQLWTLVGKAPGMGLTKTSKLLARKRPTLFPVYDKVIDQVLELGGTHMMWAKYRSWLLKDDPAHGKTLIAHAGDLAAAAGIPSHISPLRVVDVVIWMEFRSEVLRA
ncbi:DUF6308 family protein [Demequina sp. SYSU T00068]|uniref:DUF6308 family protein n=1 Tax=Demequina lignilytica TaxID=3051663 RepID=UPI00260B621B|nr:DUF6308 family protein [Demequina sp. SYSU T00068]MDN4489253.1 DUF6308 family protein [Demequina sp. SYSU T00068]